MQHEQLSMFDLFAAPVEETTQPTPAPDTGPVPVMIQASAKTGDGYRIFGIVRAEVALQGWRPTAGDALALFPISLSYEISRGLLDRSCVVDLYAHETDGDGNVLNVQADAHASISAAELYAAADATGSF